MLSKRDRPLFRPGFSAMPLIFDKNLSLSQPHTFQTGAGLEKQIVTLAD
ncbi:MAG: hypothetical protein ACOYM3_27145 [Terrimicrobiaceae bacterium]